MKAATGKKVAWIDGKWDSKLDVKYGPHDPAHLLWETHPWPADAEKYYGVRRSSQPGPLVRVPWADDDDDDLAHLVPVCARQWTYFTMALNQLDPSFADLLPRSDSRFNPAQRALEEGRLDEAERAKLALETQQRARNRAREERGERWTPRFFEAQEDGEGYVYKGGYWEARRDVRLAAASRPSFARRFLTDWAPRATQQGTFEDLDLW
jgi:hypothetical protein